MDAILHKLCEKSQQELWDLLKENNWTKDHAEVAFYMVEILKGVKKIEHLKLVQEAMDRAEEMGEQGMEHMLGKEQNMHHYARRGGRMSGRPKMPSNYSMFDYGEGEWENKPSEPEKYPNWGEVRHYPPTYYGDKEEKEKEKEKNKIVAEHFEKKYKEMLEDKWEKEKNEKQGGRMPPPPPPTAK